MNEERADYLIRQRDRLYDRKQLFNDHWEDLARVMLPRRMGFTSGTQDGDRRTEDLFDGTAMQAARTLANNVAFWLFPEGEDWVFLNAEDQRLNQVAEAKAWMDDARDMLMRAMYNPRAKFRQARGETDIDLVVFGTAVLFVGESQNLDSLTYQSLHLKDCNVFFDEDGRSQGIYRDREMSLRNAADYFGINNLGKKCKEEYRKETPDLNKRVKLLHCVVPRNEYKGGRTNKRMPFADVWLDVDDKHIIREGGFMEFPFVVPRWDTTAGEDYGRSPGMIALPDANTSQAMEETALIAGQRIADPPMMAPNDGAFRELNTFPGGLSYYDVETAAEVGGNPIFPLTTGANLPLTREMQNDKRQSIMAAFFRNILNLPMNGPQMTATEVLERKEEFIRELGAVFGRLDTDYRAPIVERSFNIMLRAGALPEIPEVLQGRNVRFQFESPINKVRQQVKASSAKAWAIDVLGMAQFDPKLKYLVNLEALHRFVAESGNIPHSLMNSREEIDQMVQAEQQQQAAMQKMAAVQGMVETAEKGTKAMKNLGVGVNEGQGNKGGGDEKSALMAGLLALVNTQRAPIKVQRDESGRVVGAVRET